MAEKPSGHVSYREAQTGVNLLLKYFVGLQPSNPHMNKAREVFGNLCVLFDASDEWEKLNPGVDDETQQDIARRNYWIRRAEQGIFTEEQDHAAMDQEIQEQEAKAEIRKQWLEGLLPEDKDDEEVA